MPDKTMDEAPETNKEPTPESGSPRGFRRYIVFLGIVIVVVAAGAWLYTTRPALVSRILPILNRHRPLGQPVPVLSGPIPQNLLSSGEVLSSVGKSPAQLVKGLFPEIGGPTPSEASVSTEACPPNPLSSPVDQSEAQGQPPGKPVATPGRSVSPRMIETPVIVHRAPSNEPAGTSRKETASRAPSSPEDVAAKTKSTNGLKRRPAVELPGERKKTAKQRLASVRPESRHQGRKGSRNTGTEKHAGEVDEAKGERFELPGSLMVAIKDYHGSVVKWGLMVVLDDSLAMGKKTKAWNPPRETVATSFINKLPTIMTPGSRMAVRDFLCSHKRRRHKCLSHVLFDWDGAPYKHLDEKLKNVEPAGRTDPCAAAAYAVKKDLSDLGQLSARVLLVTGGRARCNVREVLRALAHHKARGTVAVDVVALGMPRRTARGYASMAKRSQGAFLRADNPGEIDKVLARYKKILSKRAMEKIEIRGENAVFTVNPGEEITLAPGTYSAVLPLVAKLKAAKRTIGDIKIRSGKSTVVHVRIRKGRPIVKTAKK